MPFAHEICHLEITWLKEVDKRSSGISDFLSSTKTVAGGPFQSQGLTRASHCHFLTSSDNSNDKGGLR